MVQYRNGTLPFTNRSFDFEQTHGICSLSFSACLRLCSTRSSAIVAGKPREHGDSRSDGIQLDLGRSGRDTQTAPDRLFERWKVLCAAQIHRRYLPQRGRDLEHVRFTIIVSPGGN